MKNPERLVISGFTMVELVMVMAIASILLALTFGLARHVDTIVKIRRAQAEIAEWHDTFERWFVKFGTYPYAAINTENGIIEKLPEPDWNLNNPLKYPLTILTNELSGAQYYFNPPGTNVTLRAFLTTSISTVDPWGTPYIYIVSDNAKDYTLFSCGPDRQTLVNNAILPSEARQRYLNPALDDVYFER